MKKENLMNLAKKAAESSYSKYSGQRSGAALLADNGIVYCGANIEIAGSTASCCAARVALISAIAAGARNFSAIAIANSLSSSQSLCGVCRQSLAEFCVPNMPVYLLGENGTDKTTIAELLPNWGYRSPEWPTINSIDPIVTDGDVHPFDLITLAFFGREHCYAPYSNYYVGAALRAASGKIYLGGNVEIAGRTSVICAERVALFQAVFAGERDFTDIAIVGALKGTLFKDFSYANPCAVCRQALCEFDDGALKIHLARTPDDYETRTLEELLPHAFRVSSYK